MTPTDLQLNEIEKYFNSRDLPAVFKLNAATTINDLRGFITNVFSIVRTPNVSELVVRVRWDDLCQIRRQLETENVGK